MDGSVARRLVFTVWVACWVGVSAHAADCKVSICKKTSAFTISKVSLLQWYFILCDGMVPYDLEVRETACMARLALLAFINNFLAYFGLGCLVSLCVSRNILSDETPKLFVTLMCILPRSSPHLDVS